MDVDYYELMTVVIAILIIIVGCTISLRAGYKMGKEDLVGEVNRRITRAVDTNRLARKQKFSAEDTNAKS